MYGNKMSRRIKVSDKRNAVLWSLLMCALMIGSAVIAPLLREGGQAIKPLYMIFLAGLSVAASAYVYFFEAGAIKGILFGLIPLVYVISFALLLLFDKPLIFPFWCFGGTLLLCAFKLRYGMLLNYFLLFVIGSMQNQPSGEVLVIHMLCLILLGFVMPFAKSWRNGVNILISIAAVVISVRIVFFFIIGKEALTSDIFYIVAVYGAIVFAVILFSGLLQENLLPEYKDESFDFLEELAAGAEEQDTELLNYLALTEEYTQNTEAVITTEEASVSQAAETPGKEEYNALSEVLQKLCAEDAPLLLQLSQKNTEAYLHVKRVAQLAEDIAKRLDGVNPLLVKCGGYYHEIGRLRGRNTLDNTLAVAKQEGFPELLIHVLKEHTVNGDKPTTKEAALLLLTDNICGMCEYLKKTQEGKILVVKVIDKALALRISKEDLSQSGLTVKEFSIIRNAMTELIKEDMF